MFCDVPAAGVLAEDAAAAAVGSMAAEVAEAAAEALEKILPASAEEEIRAWTLAVGLELDRLLLPCACDGCGWNATFLAHAWSFFDDLCLCLSLLFILLPRLGTSLVSAGRPPVLRIPSTTCETEGLPSVAVLFLASEAEDEADAALGFSPVRSSS